MGGVGGSAWLKSTKLTCVFTLLPQNNNLLHRRSYIVLSNSVPVSVGTFLKLLQRVFLEVIMSCLCAASCKQLPIWIGLHTCCLFVFDYCATWVRILTPNESPPPLNRSGNNHLFYRFPALPSRISLLTPASCFLIGLGIDCPPFTPLPSRWPITNEPSMKCTRTQKQYTLQKAWRYNLSVPFIYSATQKLISSFKSLQDDFTFSES